MVPKAEDGLWLEGLAAAFSNADLISYAGSAPSPEGPKSTVRCAGRPLSGADEGLGFGLSGEV